jgi:hypothetical protein
MHFWILLSGAIESLMLYFVPRGGSFQVYSIDACVILPAISFYPSFQKIV